MSWIFALIVGLAAGYFLGSNIARGRAALANEDAKREGYLEARLAIEDEIGFMEKEEESERQRRDRWLEEMGSVPVEGLFDRELLIDFARGGPPKYRKFRGESVRYDDTGIYLVGWCYERKEQRHLSLDRIRDVADPSSRETYGGGVDWLDNMGMNPKWPEWVDLSQYR